MASSINFILLILNGRKLGCYYKTHVSQKKLSMVFLIVLVG